MKIGDEPVAVIGDERRIKATELPEADWEGATSRMIHKSENLPERDSIVSHVDHGLQNDQRIKRAFPGSIDNRSGIFFARTKIKRSVR